MADERTLGLPTPPEPTPEEMGEAPVQEQPAPSGPARDQSGKFVPQQPANDGQAPAEPAAQEDPRDKQIRGLEAAIRELRAERRKEAQPEQKPPGPKAPPPDTHVDPLGKIEYQDTVIEDLRQQLQAIQQGTQQQQYEAQVTNFLVGQIEAYKAEAPDVEDAFRHAVAEAHKAGAERGMTPQEAQQQINQWVLNTTAQCAQLGINPAIVIMHKAREMGYQPKPAAPPPAQEQPAPAAPAPKPPGPVSLSSMTGGAPSSGSVMNPMNMNWRDHQNVSDAEFMRMNGVR